MISKGLNFTFKMERIWTTVYNRPLNLFQRCKNSVDTGGISDLFKQIIIFSFTSCFMVKKIKIYEMDTSKISAYNIFSNKIEDIELRVLSSENELNLLIAGGYDLNFYRNLKIDKTRFERKASLMLIFAGKILVFKCWLAFSKEAANVLAPYIRSIPYQGEAIGESAATNPEFRSKGLFQYAVNNCIAYAQRMGKPKILTSIYDKNLAARRVHEKFGARPVYGGHHIRLLYLWDFYRLSSIQDNSN